MLEEPLHPRMIKLGEEVADISVEYPVHLPLGDPDRERIHRVMRATPGPESVRETPEVLLVHGVHHLHTRPLKDLLLHHGHPRRPLSSPPLSGRAPGLVRRLRRYYEVVFLPGLVHLRRTASAFSERPAR